jgi:hypothetical protein
MCEHIFLSCNPMKIIIDDLHSLAFIQYLGTPLIARKLC